MKLRSAIAITAILLLPALAQAETGTTLKADSIRKEPYADAKTVGSFTRGEQVDILAKQGGWLKIKTRKTTGWVRLLSVKRGSSGTRTTAEAAGVLGIATGRAGTGQVVATTGVRGLSAEELKSAKFNEAEIKAMEGYTLNAEEGSSFAAKGGLKPIGFSSIKAPKAGGSQ